MLILFIITHQQWFSLNYKEDTLRKKGKKYTTH